ncbi:hypothetical protein G7075_00220 [Phycicoccus sp. HDW14]|uniref:hypothetical protein n=1 Tax=Phycicoccus sp. HDW14 TaxID=2714941 RepID=UPI00140E09B4|nr:hypothetical protein [Phycicoccus sp. HDW14]QIM19921.1 hypothetical protein G7075_00220 [Phycicoccus sp. HDW14]
MDDVEAYERLAARVRAAAELVGVRRAGLLVDGGPGWVGPAAERYRASVEERVARLAGLEDELEWLADAVTELAAAVRAERLAGGTGLGGAGLGGAGLGRAS